MKFYLLDFDLESLQNLVTHRCINIFLLCYVYNIIQHNVCTIMLYIQQHMYAQHNTYVVHTYNNICMLYIRTTTYVCTT